MEKAYTERIKQAARDARTDFTIAQIQKTQTKLLKKQVKIFLVTSLK